MVLALVKDNPPDKDAFRFSRKHLTAANELIIAH